jgi:hypothetical protein
MAKKKDVEDLPHVREPTYDYDVVYDKSGRIPVFSGRKQKIELLTFNVGKLKNGVKVMRGSRVAKKGEKVIKERWCWVQ